MPLIPFSMELNVTKIVIQYIIPVPELLYLPTRVPSLLCLCSSSSEMFFLHRYSLPHFLLSRTATAPQDRDTPRGTARDTHLLLCCRSPKAALYVTTHWTLVGDRCRNILLLVCFSCCVTASSKANDTMVRL